MFLKRFDVDTVMCCDYYYFMWENESELKITLTMTDGETQTKQLVPRPPVRFNYFLSQIQTVNHLETSGLSLRLFLIRQQHLSNVRNLVFQLETRPSLYRIIQSSPDPLSPVETMFLYK